MNGSLNGRLRVVVTGMGAVTPLGNDVESTWENLVDYDMSESGVRPLTLRELVAMGFDLDAFLDQPLQAVGQDVGGDLLL